MTDDPQEENAKVTELSAKRALAAEAEALLDEKGVFMRAVRSVRIKWHRELLDTRDEHTEKLLTANLRALDAVPQMLQTAINDLAVVVDRQRKHG
jgi:hypothetical protein